MQKFTYAAPQSVAEDGENRPAGRPADARQVDRSREGADEGCRYAAGVHYKLLPGSALPLRFPLS